MSVKLPGRNSPPPPHQNGATWLALMFLLAMAGGFVALVAMMMPQLIYGILFLAGISGTIALHYFTWGRWLMRQERPPEE